MRISDWSSDVCSSDLLGQRPSAQPRLQRRARREPLDAVVVEAADARCRVVGKARDEDMADLAVAESARRLAMDDQPDADAGADGHLSEIIEAASAAPSVFGQRRPLDSGVETYWHGTGRF